MLNGHDYIFQRFFAPLEVQASPRFCSPWPSCWYKFSGNWSGQHYDRSCIDPGRDI